MGMNHFDRKQMLAKRTGSKFSFSKCSASGSSLLSVATESILLYFNTSCRLEALEFSKAPVRHKTVHSGYKGRLSHLNIMPPYLSFSMYAHLSVSSAYLCRG